MSIFDYKEKQDKTVINDALIINAYSTELSGFTLETSFEKMASDAGWKILSAEDIGYSGSCDRYDIFSGEQDFYWSAQVNIFGKYDDAGNLISLGVCYWGTGDVIDSPTNSENTQMDTIHDLLTTIDGFANTYVENAFGELLSTLANYAIKNGLGGEDVLFSGMSLGGMAVNSTAMASANGAWNSFYENADYIAISSPVQNTFDDKVLNIGCENDPVYRVLDGTHITFPDSLLAHDTPQETCVNNLVMFNDFYAASDFTIFSIAGMMWGTWAGHNAADYVEGLKTVLSSQTYNFTDRDSTVIVSRMSDEMREKTWVEDLNRFADPHHGPTFILGSEKADLISGGAGIDYLEGFTGDDTFRDAGSSNIIFGGDGYDLFDLQSEISKTSVAQSVTGMTFIKGADGGITLLQDVEAIRETYWEWFQTRTITYEITCRGLEVDGNVALGYANAVHGSMTGQASEIFAPQDGGFYTNTTSWLFSYNGDTIMHGSTTDDVFICGIGNDQMYANGGSDTFLFASDNFGHNAIYGFGSDDQIVILANKETTANSNWLDYLSEDSDGLMFSCGESSISLVGLSLDQVHENQFVLA
ncbi:polyurethanase [Jejubacter calystegiae]|uniref:Polyurethanase n=1 Tax=Jejubacter calystegiae TaxID=2579935 RepID=A0A4P8YI87_9ENTR|nr:polyurethanase [Jejubacter calystegiae]QCT19304.1 polyurethanase [Jejubacter calystegiae]